MSTPAARLAPPALDAKSIPQALAVLDHYDTGSGRGPLVALDILAARSSEDQRFRQQLEKGLIQKLRANLSATAREYICSKLAMMGTDASVPALASLLCDPNVSTAALNALTNLPGSTPAKALRKCLHSLAGLELIGCIYALSSRRDEGSVSALAPLLRHTSPRVAAAAAQALGEIGSAKASRILRDSYPTSPEPVRASMNDALLECAEKLTQAGKETEAQSVYSFLVKSCPFKQVVAAARAHLRQQ